MAEGIRLDISKKPVPISSSGVAIPNKTPVKNDDNIGMALSGTKAAEEIKTPVESSSIEKSPNPKLAEYNIDLNKPFTITKEMIAKMKSKGKKGFWESLKDGAVNAIPFVSSIIEIKKSIDLMAIAKKQQNGEALTKEEKEKMYSYLLEQVENEHRGSSFMGKVGSMLSHLPAFAIEFWLTGGIYSFGKNLAGKTATKLLGEVTKQQTAKYITKKVAEVAVGAAARTFFLSNTYNGIFQRRLNLDASKMNEDGTGELTLENTKESWNASIGKGLLDGYIESLSEQSGEGISYAFSKPLSKIPFLGKALVPPVKTQSFLAKTGFHGLFEEYAEERFGGVLRALTGLDERNMSTAEKLYDAIAPGWEQTGVELTTTALWGGALSTGHMGVNKFKSGINVNELKTQAHQAALDAGITAMTTGTEVLGMVNDFGLEKAVAIPSALSRIAASSRFGQIANAVRNFFTPNKTIARTAAAGSARHILANSRFMASIMSALGLYTQVDRVPSSKLYQDKIMEEMSKVKQFQDRGYSVEDMPEIAKAMNSGNFNYGISENYWQNIKNKAFVEFLNAKNSVQVGKKKIFLTEQQKAEYNRILKSLNTDNISTEHFKQAIETDVLFLEALGMLFGIDINGKTKEAIFNELGEKFINNPADENTRILSQIKFGEMEKAAEDYIVRPSLEDAIPKGDHLIHEFTKYMAQHYETNEAFRNKWIEFCKNNTEFKEYVAAVTTLENSFRKLLIKKGISESVINEKIKNLTHLIYRSIQRDAVVLSYNWDKVPVEKWFDTPETSAKLEDGSQIEVQTFIEELAKILEEEIDKPIPLPGKHHQLATYHKGNAKAQIETLIYLMEDWKENADYVPAK